MYRITCPNRTSSAGKDPQLGRDRSAFMYIPEANASTLIDNVTGTGSPAGSGRSTVSRSGTNAAFAPRSSFRNSTASTTARSAVVDSSSTAFTSVNSADRCDR
jgi:hypothetical protein